MLSFIFFIIVTVILGYIIYQQWISLNPKQKPTAKGIINILVENNPLNKTPTTNRQEIIKEAEAMFKTLQKKYLYSPVPFKVLGDFYAEKGLFDKAIEKYTQMIRYLNQDLDLEKLSSVLLFLSEQGKLDTVDLIKQHYQEIE